MMRTILKEEERAFLAECIKLYRDLPALWNVKSKVYHDREKKNKSYDILVSKYREMYPSATREDVKRKINALRTNYRKELKKQMDSIERGATGSDVYEPTLWYYNLMTFLQDHEISDSAEYPLETTHRSFDVKIEEKETEQNHESHVSSLEDTDDSSPRSPQSTSNDKSSRKSLKKHIFKKAKDKDKISNSSFERIRESKNEFYYWAMACAADLRKMDRTQQVYAKKAIAEILMEGQLGQLHRHSVQINSSHEDGLYRSNPTTTCIDPLSVQISEQKHLED